MRPACPDLGKNRGEWEDQQRLAMPVGNETSSGARSLAGGLSGVVAWPPSKGCWVMRGSLGLSD